MQPAPSTSTSTSVASAFNPEGASTPSQGAVAFENAVDNQDAAALCNLITPAYVVAVAQALKASSSESCVDLWTSSWRTDGPSPIPPQEENPTVVSVQQAGDTAQVVIDYNIPPGSGATLANSTDTLVLQNGRWLVTPEGN
jgi:ketosteroid isomerase-like protein